MEDEKQNSEQGDQEEEHDGNQEKEEPIQPEESSHGGLDNRVESSNDILQNNDINQAPASQQGKESIHFNQEEQTRGSQEGTSGGYILNTIAKKKKKSCSILLYIFYILVIIQIICVLLNFNIESGDQGDKSSQKSINEPNSMKQQETDPNPYRAVGDVMKHWFDRLQLLGDKDQMEDIQKLEQKEEADENMVDRDEEKGEEASGAWEFVNQNEENATDKQVLADATDEQLDHAPLLEEEQQEKQEQQEQQEKESDNSQIQSTKEVGVRKWWTKLSTLHRCSFYSSCFSL